MKSEHIHIDPVGGISGDMFIAAVIDTVPGLEPRVMSCVKTLQGLNTSASIRKHRDKLHEGRRFHVKSVSPPQHDHKTFTSIIGELKGAALNEVARRPTGSSLQKWKTTMFC